MWLLTLLLGAAPADERALGEAAWEAGDQAAALTHWGLALESARSAKNTREQVDLLVRIAAVHRELGRVSSARGFLDAADKLAPGDAAVTIGRGLVSLDSGDARAAETSFSAAFKATKASDPRLAMDAAVDLGLARAALGHVAEAAKAYDVAIATATALKDERALADALVDRGLLSRRRGDLRGALADVTAARAKYYGLHDLAGQIDADTDLGLIWQDLGDHDRAMHAFGDALAGAQLRKDVRRQAALFQNIGTLKHAALDPKAADWYVEAEKAWASVGQPEAAAAVALDRAMLGTPDVATLKVILFRAGTNKKLAAMVAVNLAGLLVESDAPEARRLVAEARVTGEKLALDEVVWRCDYLDGRLSTGAPRLAALKRAVDHLEATRSTLDTNAQQSFAVSHDDVYKALVDELLKSGDAKGALVYMQRAHLSREGGAPPATTPAAVAAVDAYTAAADQTRWLASSLANATDEQAELLRAQLAVQRVTFAQEVDSLRILYPNFDQLVRIDPEDIEAVQSGLPPGVLVVEPIILDTRVEILVVSHDGVAAVDSLASPASVTQDALVLAREMRAGGTNDDYWTNDITTRLGEALLRPIADKLSTAKLVIFCVDGPLRQLPMAMLKLDGQWLVEKAAVINVTNVASLRGGVGAYHVDPKALLLIGNPDGSLPGAEAEVRGLASSWPGSEVMVGAEGTREALRLKAPGHSTVHLATHGVVDWYDPQASFLVLAGYPDPTGRLGYAEIPGMAPWLQDVRMVVLSACNSATPAFSYNGGGSINGLAAQFRRAGVETLVASLWPVSDDGTVALMEGFYGEIAKGKDLATSMQAAQLKMLHDPMWTNPYFWAPFVLFGDWR